MKLSDNVVRSFKVAKLFRDNTEKVNSMDFSSEGSHLISCSKDDKIMIYDCDKGTRLHTVYSKKYGVDLIRFTLTKNTVVYSSTKVDDTIRYLYLNDNKFIRYFPGHTRRVISLCVSPVRDTFLSTSLDKSVRLWDIRSPSRQGILQMSSPPIASYDPAGLIFATGTNSETVKLYDVRSYERGPFSTFKMGQDKDCAWTGLNFSGDGKTILISTNGSVIHLIDAFTGNLLQTITGYLNDRRIPMEASFSSDSKFVFSGSTDGRVHIWNAEIGYKVCVLRSDHPGPIHCIQFNPKFMMFASACSDTALWLPTVNR